MKTDLRISSMRRQKWAAIYRDSFTANITTTQRSEGLNNVFKKRFCRKLGISELLVECEKVSASLRENELDADFNSCRKEWVSYIINFPLLNHIQGGCIQSLRKNLKANFHSLVNYYKQRGQT